MNFDENFVRVILQTQSQTHGIYGLRISQFNGTRRVDSALDTTLRPDTNAPQRTEFCTPRFFMKKILIIAACLIVAGCEHQQNDKSFSVKPYGTMTVEQGKQNIPMQIDPAVRDAFEIIGGQVTLNITPYDTGKSQSVPSNSYTVKRRAFSLNDFCEKAPQDVGKWMREAQPKIGSLSDYEKLFFTDSKGNRWRATKIRSGVLIEYLIPGSADGWLSVASFEF